MHRILAACALACALPAIALAQQAPGPVVSTVVDLSPLITEALKILGGVISILVYIAVKKWLGEKTANEVKALIEPIMQNGLAHGQAITQRLPHSFDAKSEIVAEAARYVVKHAGDKLKGISEADLEDALRARLEANVSAQSSEVTATAAAPMPTTVAAKPVEVVPVPVAVPVAPVDPNPQPKESPT